MDGAPDQTSGDLGANSGFAIDMVSELWQVILCYSLPSYKRISVILAFKSKYNIQYMGYNYEQIKNEFQNVLIGR